MRDDSLAKTFVIPKIADRSLWWKWSVSDRQYIKKFRERIIWLYKQLKT